MTYTSHLGDVLARLERAQDAALVAAGEVVKAEVKKRIREQLYDTGALFQSVNTTPPQSDASGRFIMIGTSISDPAYPLFWEIGHHNVFTRRFEHRPIWVPALLETRAQQLEMAHAAAAATLGGGGAAPSFSEAAD